MINRPWPVYYENAGVKSYLVYYIGAYIIPAAIGKVFGSFEVGEIVQFLYNALILSLIWVFIIDYLRIKKIWHGICAVIFITCFGGSLMLAQSVISIFYPDISCLGNLYAVDGEGVFLEYKDFFVDLSWTWPQYIFPALFILLWIVNKDDTQNYVFYLLPLLLYASMPFVSVVIIVFTTAIYMVINKQKKITEFLSWQNIIVSVTLGTILILYFWGNLANDKPSDIAFKMIHFGKYFGVYLIYSIFMFGIYAYIVSKRNARNPVLWSSVLILLIIPFFSMGYFNDLMMNMSIPPMFYLMILCLDYFVNDDERSALRENGKTAEYIIYRSVLITLIAISMVYPFENMSELIRKNTNGKDGNYSWVSLESCANPSLEIRDDLKYNYFAYDINNRFFYRHVARKQIDD